MAQRLGDLGWVEDELHRAECGPKPGEVATALTLAEQREGTFGQRHGVADEPLLRLEDAGVPVRRRSGDRGGQALGLGDGLAAGPDRLAGVAALVVRRRQGDRHLDGLVGAVERSAGQLGQDALADLGRLHRSPDSR